MEGVSYIPHTDTLVHLKKHTSFNPVNNGSFSHPRTENAKNLYAKVSGKWHACLTLTALYQKHDRDPAEVCKRGKDGKD